MSDTEKPEKVEGKSRPHRATSQGFRAQREAALTKALRANLRRRKAPEKNEISPADPDAPADHENAQTDESGNP
jgi:hypothetical protein